MKKALFMMLIASFVVLVAPSRSHAEDVYAIESSHVFDGETLHPGWVVVVRGLESSFEVLEEVRPSSASLDARPSRKIESEMRVGDEEDAGQIHRSRARSWSFVSVADGPTWRCSGRSWLTRRRISLVRTVKRS